MLTDAQISAYVAAHSYACAFAIGVAVGLLCRGKNPLEIYRQWKGGSK